MYHPCKYEEHDRALNNLITKFNKVANRLGNEVQMYFQEKENYRDDGGVIFTATGEKFLYDFENKTFNCKSFVLISTPQGKYLNTPIFDIECNDLIELVTRQNSDYKEVAKLEIKRRMCENG